MTADTAENFSGMGATPAQWDEAIKAGLLKQLLPVVQDPSIPIAPSSKLKTVGKVPSRVTGEGNAVGFPGWTHHVTTAAEVDAWRKNPAHGICVRIENGCAYDCDVEDPVISQGILNIARRHFGERLPIRRRGGSNRWLALFEIPGAQLPKERYPLKNGEIPERLGIGQQCVIQGTHPSGSRYYWQGSICDRPVISQDDFNAFTQEVRDTYGAGYVQASKLPRRRDGDSEPVYGRLYHWLRAHWKVNERTDGVLDMVCPWEHEHTGGEELNTSTTYYCAGTNGHPEEAFVCLHAHCADRNIQDLVDWAVSKGFQRTGPEDFDGVEADPPKTARDDGTSMTKAEQDDWSECMADIERYRDKDSGSISANLITVCAALKAGADYCGIDVRYDTFRSTEVFRRSRKDDWQPLTDARLVDVRKHLQQARAFTRISRELMADAVLLVGDQCAFDSMVEYLKATLPAWDGVDRITNFFETYCGAKSTPYEWAVARYLFEALYGRSVSVKGIKADIVPVLVGKQGARKSTLVRSLALRPDLAGEISLETRDADLARQIRGKSVSEIPELVGMSKKDVAAVKYWISLDKDAYIQKYQERETVSPRRCLMMMTTNVHDFLTDPTGNRRFAPIEVEDIDIEAVERDRLQLWAQAKVLFEKEGIDHRSVEALSAKVNEQYMWSDPWEEAITQWLDSRGLEPEAAQQALTAANLLQCAIGAAVSRVSPADGRRLETVMSKLGYKRSSTRIDGKKVRIYVSAANLVGAASDEVPF